LDLLALADSYQEQANTTPGMAGTAAQDAADTLRLAAAARLEADTLAAQLVNGDAPELAIA
jgi:hypothetical protein